MSAAPPSQSAHGLLLFAHGSRDAIWAAPFEAVAERAQAQRPDRPVMLAYLELMKPDLREAATALVDAGCTSVDVVPLFLGTGSHLRRDLPVLLQRLREQHPQVQWTLHGAIGEHPDVIDAIAQAALAAATR